MLSLENGSLAKTEVENVSVSKKIEITKIKKDFNPQPIDENFKLENVLFQII